MKNIIVSIIILLLIIAGLIVEYFQDKKRGEVTMDMIGLSWMAAFLLAFFLVLVLILPRAYGHDHARPELNKWYENLRNDDGGRCCDGQEIDTGTARRLADEDWDVRDGHYRVLLDGQWIDVPDWAVVTKPNLDGRTLLWLYAGHIQCFLPGSGV